MDFWNKWAGAQYWRFQGRVASNRRDLYGGSHGLRIVAFHSIRAPELDMAKRMLDWIGDRYPLASPEDADAVFEGRYVPGTSDRVMVTFDDGLATDYAAARWLADAGVRAAFFIVPSLVDRTVGQFVEFHAQRGVQAFLLDEPSARGLSTTQVREMIAMGHRIGAHNFAHRDLGRLHSDAEIDYEVGLAIDTVGELTGESCRDFAIAFGQPHNVSDEATRYLLARCPRVYAAHRGLNVPGITPRFLLRHACSADQPMAFAQLCVEGGADHHLAHLAREMVRRVGTTPASMANVVRPLAATAGAKA